MSTFSGDITDALLGINGLYVDDCEISQLCPNCGKMAFNNLDSDYISYGVVDLWFTCPDYENGCKTEWKAKGSIKATAEITLSGEIEIM